VAKRFFTLGRMLLLGSLACFIVGYLLGSIPTGYLVARARGVDLRQVGSGNIGATNAFRVLGRGPGLVVLAGDALKGYLACTVGYQSCLRLLEACGVAAGASEVARVMAGLGAVLGHTYTFWLRFRGGKGIATSAGVFAALAPWALAVALAGWILVLACFRYVSLASIAAAVLLPAMVWVMREHAFLCWVTTLVGVLVIARHHANLKRLWLGTEPKVQWRGGHRA
jgi:glycerol-3-phosphate acyltransferase PlsY